MKRTFLRQATYEALLSVVAAILLANAIILIGGLEDWEKLILGAGPFVFLACVSISILTLTLMYFQKVGKYRRERAVLLLLLLLLSVVAGAVSGVLHGDFNSLTSQNGSVAVAMFLGYGTLVVNFGVAALAANLLADLFKKI